VPLNASESVAAREVKFQAEPWESPQIESRKIHEFPSIFVTSVDQGKKAFGGNLDEDY
jgi:hypothetical protein